MAGLTPDVLSLLNANNKLLGIPTLPSVLAPPPTTMGLPPRVVPRDHRVAARFKPGSPMAVIAKHARRLGLDPAAVLAYALEESGGKWGAVGDQGTSFGPFQAHIGGAAGNRSRQSASAWANSPQGLVQMMAMMSRTPAKGLKGAAAVKAIYQYFGKGTPAAVPKGLARLAQAQSMLAQGGASIVVDHNEKVAPVAASVIKLAAQYLGTPYKYGGASPQSGFDCSGFVQWLYGQKGIRLPRTTFDQARVGRAVGRGKLKAGDIIFFHTEDDPRGAATHEGLMISPTQFIQAPHTGDVVKISSINDSYYRKHFLGARRIV